MKFTKEEIETAIAVIDSQGHNEDDMISIKCLKEYLNSLLKPQRKKIIVEIEYQAQINLNASKVQGCMESSSCYYDKNALNFKVTELSEVFTRQDMIEFAKIDHIRYCDIEPNLEKFKAERKPK